MPKKLSTYGTDGSGNVTLAGALTIGTGDATAQLILPTSNDAVSPTLAFGDGDSGFFESADDTLQVSLGLTARYMFTGNFFRAVTTGGPGLLNEASSAINPVFAPVFGDATTGIGGVSGTVSLITGGVERITVDATGTADCNKGTADEGFLNFKATIDADATSAISSLTTSGAVTHHIQVELNGTTAWIPCSTTDPT